MSSMSEPSGASAPGTRGVFQRFFHSEASGSILLLLATVFALAWANSPWADLYQRMLHVKLGLTLGSWTFSMSAAHWVNDGLMAVFFFVVGLEIKRELLVGQLSTCTRSPPSSCCPSSRSSTPASASPGTSARRFSSR